MSKPLSRLLRREQTAFLGRDRAAWGDHLDRVRAFLGEGLQAADPSKPVLILGAGSGLEIPWELAPRETTGWDADPWSRVRTALRHRRWAPWVFGDLTGELDDLAATTRRAVMEPWSRRQRGTGAGSRRLAGLLPSLQPNPEALRTWIGMHRPGTILAANVMGQFGAVAERVVESAFGSISPWEEDPERTDPLAEALDQWVQRALAAFLEVLRDSGADLWLVHDRAVLFGDGAVALGPWEDSWARQLRLGGQAFDVNDPLVGLEVPVLLAVEGLALRRKERWLWPLAPGQHHVVEALALRRIAEPR